MSDLPDFEYHKSKFSPKVIFSILSLILVVIAIPVGAYLATQTAIFAPQAEEVIPEPTPFQSEFILQKEDIESTISGEILVDVIALVNEKSNLFSTNLTFPFNLLQVESIETSSPNPNKNYFVTNWLEKYYDNQTGQISLVGGVPNPGIASDPLKKQQLVFATIKFKAISPGDAQINFNNVSQILRNSDNVNIFHNSQDLTLAISDLSVSPPTPTPNPNCVQRPACLDATPACRRTEPQSGWCSITPTLSVITPQGGAIFNYQNPIPITWEATGVGALNINLYLNSSLLGVIAENLTGVKSYDWLPQQTLPLIYANPSNTFQIELVDKSHPLNPIKAYTNGPFAIISPTNGVSNIPASSNVAEVFKDLNNDGKVDLVDASILLSNFGKNDLSLDFNDDGVVNAIDLWQLQKALIIQNVINPS